MVYLGRNERWRLNPKGGGGGPLNGMLHLTSGVRESLLGSRGDFCIEEPSAPGRDVILQRMQRFPSAVYSDLVDRDISYVVLRSFSDTRGVRCKECILKPQGCEGFLQVGCVCLISETDKGASDFIA